MKNFGRLLKPVLSAFVALMIFAMPIEAMALSASTATPNFGAVDNHIQTSDIQTIDSEVLYNEFYNSATDFEQKAKEAIENLDAIDGKLLACLTNCTRTSSNRNNGERGAVGLSIFGAMFGLMGFGLFHSYSNWKDGGVTAVTTLLILSHILETTLLGWYALATGDLLIVTTVVMMAFAMGVMMGSLPAYSLAPAQNAEFASATTANGPTQVNVTISGHTKQVTLVPHNYQGQTSGVVFRETGDSTGIFMGNLREILPSNMVELLTSSDKRNMQAQIWIPRTNENGSPTARPASNLVTIIPANALKLTPKQVTELLKAGSKQDENVGWREVAKSLSPRGQRSNKPMQGSVVIIPKGLHNPEQAATWKETAKSTDGNGGSNIRASALVVPEA